MARSLKHREFMLSYLKKALAYAEADKSGCVLCMREFYPHEKPKQISRVTLPTRMALSIAYASFQFRTQIEKILKEADEEMIREADRDLQEIREAGPSYDSYVRLTRTEIPALEQELEEHQRAKEQLLEQYSKVRNQSSYYVYCEANR
jgi:DNA repair protein RAD50